MIDEVAAFDDDIIHYLEGNEPSEDELHKCIRAGVNSLELTPVYMGSAFKNKGVQPLLNVARYLPSPVSCEKSVAIKETKDGMKNYS